MTVSDSLVRLALRRLPSDCLVALNFHRVGDDLPPWHFGTRPELLERLVSVFARELRPVTLHELRESSIRGRLLALTFDDGFADNLVTAAPLLTRLGVPASFFVSTDCVESGNVPWPDEAYSRALALPLARLKRLAARFAPGRPARSSIEAAHAFVHGLKYTSPALRARTIAALPAPAVDPGRVMNWAEVRALADLGFEIGSHGATHAPLTDLADDELTDELTRSRAALEEHLGLECFAVAYPDNRVDHRVSSTAARVGYTLGFRGGETVNGPSALGLELARFSGEDARLYAIVGRALRSPRAKLDFAEQGERYADVRAEEYSFRTQMRAVEESLRGIAPQRVLDAGCGAGALAPALRAAGAREIIGVDAERVMVDEARRRWPGLRWSQQDLTMLRFRDRWFDAVVSLGVLEYVADTGTALKELARVARPGSRVIVTVPQRRSPNAVLLRLAELAGRGAREGSRPLTALELRRAAAAAVLRVDRLWATNYFMFPFTTIAPRLSERVAETFERVGRARLARPLGGQLVASFERPSTRPLFWLAPALPTNTTFLDRELATLRALDVDVRPLTPRLDSRAVRGFVRRPARSLHLAFELQVLKASLDKERGRLGYLLLFARGLSLAERIGDEPGRLHATFADGVGTVAYVASSLTGRPYSFTAHSPFSLWRSSRLLARQLQAASTVVSETSILDERLHDLGGEFPSVVARSPAPAVQGPRQGETEPLFVAVARLIPHKGFATAVEAARLALARGVDLRLVVIGDGPERDALERAAAASGFGDRIIVGGALPNDEVIDVLRSARAMIAPCEVQPDGDRDGLPVSIVDAAAVGVPTIGTSVSSLPELVRHLETGLVVPERDPEALADAMELLASDVRLAQRLGDAAAELARVQHDPVENAVAMLRAWGDVDYTEPARRTASMNWSTPNA